MIDPPTTSTDILVNGRYRPIRMIGRGGMATVYHARDEQLGRDVALKLFRAAAPGENDLVQHQAELRVLAGLGHHGIVTLLDAGIDDTTPSEPHPYLVMELITGGNLEHLLARATLTPRAIAEIGYDLAEALDYVHSRGVVHRDVKPSNVLIVEYGTSEFRAHARLTDFGIALDSAQARGYEEANTTGTAAYLSPEQVLRDLIGPASDVYSLGLVLLECFTRQLAFPGEPVASAMARLKDDPFIPEQLGENWRVLIAAMTSRDPAERPPIREVLLALRQAIVDESGRHRPGAPTAEDEAERMNAVRRYGMLDTPTDPVFDHVTTLAARLLEVPVALISFVDHHRIYFLSHHGLDFDEIDRDDGLCGIAMREAEPWVVENASTDVRTADNPWVTGEFGMRFYASVALRAPDGFALGTLSILDFEPRTLTETEVATLVDLAALVIDELELRLEASRLRSELHGSVPLPVSAVQRTSTLPSLPEAV
jgi:serine/threonine protein kinase